MPEIVTGIADMFFGDKEEENKQIAARNKATHDEYVERTVNAPKRAADRKRDKENVTAQDKASKDLLKAKKRQDKRRKAGRASTIASGKAEEGQSKGDGQSLGGSGRKDLLGL